MIGEPTVEQIERFHYVSEQVARWKARQSDLIRGRCGTVRLATCLARQAKYLHEGSVKFDGRRYTHIDERFLKCQQCEHYTHVTNPEHVMDNCSLRITKCRVAKKEAPCPTK